MPTYDFKCPQGHVFEKFYRKVTKTERVRCPTCGKLAERQISGGAGLVFKGSGFYLTDYGRAGQKKKSEAESKSEAPKSEASKSETSKSEKPKRDTSDK